MATLQNRSGEAIQPSPAMLLRELIGGMRVTQLIYVAAKLGIADLLKDGAKSVDELASKVGAHPRALYRVLRALASIGIFSEVEDRQFELTALAEPLQDRIPGSLRASAIINGEETYWKPWGDLLNCVKTGDNPFNRVFGMGTWEYFTRNAEAGTIFNKMMSGNTERNAKVVVETYDFSGVNRVIDLAGGRGALISAILKRNPHVQGVLTDLPAVANEAKAFIESEGLEDRCEIIIGDYFESVPAGGDIYILKSTIIDEEDNGVVTILKNCRRAMGNHARLLIVDRIMPPHGSPSPANVFDVQMMVEGGGLLRTEEEHGALFEKAGFKVNRMLATKSQYSIIEGVPV